MSAVIGNPLVEDLLVPVRDGNSILTLPQVPTRPEVNDEHPTREPDFVPKQPEALDLAKRHCGQPPVAVSVRVKT